MLWAASSQASYVGNVGSVVSAGYLNVAVQCSKKISVPDVNRWLGLSAFDAYAAGLVGVEASFLGTPYAGVYGCPFDSGVTPPGYKGDNYKSDKRQHGSVCCSQEVADNLAPLFAAKHWVETEDGKGYVETPKATRGIPHHLVPGVHACFDEYLEALEHVRRAAQNDVSAVDSIMVLPCSPWAQALPPVLEATADLSTRLCVRDPTLASVVSGKRLPARRHRRARRAAARAALPPAEPDVGERQPVDHLVRVHGHLLQRRQPPGALAASST